MPRQQRHRRATIRYRLWTPQIIANATLMRLTLFVKVSDTTFPLLLPKGCVGATEKTVINSQKTFSSLEVSMVKAESPQRADSGRKPSQRPAPLGIQLPGPKHKQFEEADGSGSEKRAEPLIRVAGVQVETACGPGNWLRRFCVAGRYTYRTQVRRLNGSGRCGSKKRKPNTAVRACKP